MQTVTAIVEIRNASSFDAIVRNYETPSDTDGDKGKVVRGAKPKTIKIWVPWCSTPETDFSKHRVTVDLNGPTGLVRRFTIWQSDVGGRSDDRVHVSIQTEPTPRRRLSTESTV